VGGITTFFSRKPRRDDVHAALVVQRNLDDLAKAFDDTSTKIAMGSAQVNTGATTAVVTHNLGTNVFQAVITPTVDPGSRWWINNKTATQFTINLQVAPGGNVTFDWIAKEA
jgi:hypothetical protein